MNPRHLLALAHERFDTSGGACTLDDVLRGAQVVTVEAGGRDVGAFALRVVEHEQKRVAWVMVAAGNAPGVDLTRAAMPRIEYQARELRCEQVAVTTIRRGLVRKLEALGYEVTGITLRKKIA